ncbi:MAG TPA: histidine kinase [Rhizomicrobium sp.]|nr:histidine kinase [Rhizomicrobium sp.]
MPEYIPAGDLIAFTSAVVLTILLLVLTLRAAKLPGAPKANVVFAACALAWSLGGLLRTIFQAVGLPNTATLSTSAKALQLTGAAGFPLAVLLVWRQFAAEPRQQRSVRVVIWCALISFVGVSAMLWRAALHSPREATVVHAAVILLAGAAVSLRRATMPRVVYLTSLVIVICIAGAAISIPVSNRIASNFVLEFAGAHLILVVILCSFFLFARFRYADVFVHYGMRIVLAGVWATLLTFFMQSSLPLLFATHLHSPGAAHIFLVVLTAIGLLLSFTFVDERLSAALNRRLFHAPNYRVAAHAVAESLRAAPTEAEVLAALERGARDSLELSNAQVFAVDTIEPGILPAATLDGQTAELDPTARWQPMSGAEALIPITSNARVSHIFAVAPGAGRPGLVSAALDYLRGIAAQCGHRLDAIQRERDAVERESREALLLQHVAEAELSALRAQIHPHFLFNSLNTIADLIVRDPTRAEEMTLRLARVFRHVLAQLRQPLITVREEIAFLETYLHIEEARFGDRLRVHIDLDPEVAASDIPSLILQPLVENALKHGIGPKPGSVQLWISARAHGPFILLTVEDDGMGLEARPQALPEQPHGVGLINVAERLKTLYHDRASVRLEPREGGGARAIVTLPRAGSDQS